MSQVRLEYRHITKRIQPAPSQQAWSAYLRSERDEAAKQAYLRDAFAGTV